MLCAICFSIFQNGATSGDHHEDVAAIQAAAKNGCKICVSIPIDSWLKEEPLESPAFGFETEWSGAWRRHWRIYIFQKTHDTPRDKRRRSIGNAYVHVSKVMFSPPGYGEFIRLVTSDTESAPSKVRRDVPAPRDIPHSTGDLAVAAKARKWLSACMEEHGCDGFYHDRDASWYPKRLLSVGDSNQPPRLVTRNDHGLKGAYATLRHCWGENPGFLTLNSQNAADFAMPSRLTSLEKVSNMRLSPVAACKYPTYGLTVFAFCNPGKARATTGFTSHERWS